MLRDEGSGPDQRRAVKELSPAARIQAAMDLYYTARAFKAAALRAEHPDWSAAEIAREVRRQFLLHAD